MNRSQVSRQLVYLLNASGVLGGSGSALESPLAVEDYLASGLTLPIASVETLTADNDEEIPGRLMRARFRISVAGQATTETRLSSYVASGGAATSEKTLEGAIRDLVAYLNGGSFTDSAHGFQGRIDNVSQQRVVVAQGKFFAVADVDISAYNCAHADYYHVPTHFAAAAGSSHSISLSWTNPPLRFDSYQNVLRRGTNPGDAAPTTISGAGSGTGITITGGVLGTTASDTGHTASQTFYYSLFRTYSVSSAGDHVSGAITASATTT